MKKIMIFTFIIISSMKMKSQDLLSYFVPSAEYIDSQFIFGTDKWGNKTGEFYMENTVKYLFDSLNRAYVKDFKIVSYRNSKVVNKDYIIIAYTIDSQKVAELYSLMPDLLKGSGVLKFNLDRICLQKFSTQWVVKDSTEQRIESYKCEKTELKTPYGYYPDCIVVTKTTKVSPSQKDKMIHNMARLSQKWYYAKNIGFVKSQSYWDGKEKSDLGITIGPCSPANGILIDNFSKYSFYKKK